ncbi:MAG: tRNA (guanosine(37)-N1)-methyltransferase TrmD, partial [Armatimonadaceae bacterium]
MHVDIVTLFPEMIRQAASHSIVGRALASGVCTLGTVDPRDFTSDRHRSADDYPFGGGAGMVMKPEPLVGAIESVVPAGSGIPVILLSPDGKPFCQETARRFAGFPRMALVCGHYEGVDERVREGWITEEVSIGDYVLTGGELAALVILDATVRLLPGVLGNAESAVDESFGDGLLEYPHYTRPAEFRGRRVPDILLGGHHAKIADWRRSQSLVRTRSRRPDLWGKIVPLSKRDQ